MKKYNDLGKLINDVKNLDIQTVIELYGARTRSSGSTTNVLCDFHTGAKFSHASINRNKNRFNCYLCKISYSAIDYVMNLKNIEFKMAALDIAITTNLISKEEALTYCSEKEKVQFLNTKINPRKIIVPQRKDNSDQTDRASKEIIDKVFKTFSKSYELNNGSRLTKHDKEYLLSRNLSEQDIDRIGFFSLPTKNIMPYLKKYLKDVYGYEESILKGVPGFFKDDKGNYTFKQHRGIGIPILSSDGSIAGIQIRLSKKLILKIDDEGSTKELRYLWFSSATLPKGCCDGVCSGAPIDVLYPNVPDFEISTDLFISEGKMKTIVISNYAKATALSVQGVGNWNGIESVIDSIQKTKSIKFKRVFVCYDGDLAFNPQVNRQAQMMSDKILESFPDLEIYYSLWDTKFGKGIDDVIYNKNIDKIKFIDKNSLDSMYSELIKSLESRGFTFEELSEEDRAKLFIKEIYNKL